MAAVGQSSGTHPQSAPQCDLGTPTSTVPAVGSHCVRVKASDPKAWCPHWDLQVARSPSLTPSSLCLPLSSTDGIYYGDNRFNTVSESGTATLKARPRVRPLLTFIPLVSMFRPRLCSGCDTSPAKNGVGLPHPPRPLSTPFLPDANPGRLLGGGTAVTAGSLRLGEAPGGGGQPEAQQGFCQLMATGFLPGPGCRDGIVGISAFEVLCAYSRRCFPVEHWPGRGSWCICKGWSRRTSWKRQHLNVLIG